MSLQTTTIQILNATTSTNLVTMSIQTRLEDITLVLTANPGSAGVNLTGVYFPTTTSTTAKTRTVVVNVGSTASSPDTGNIYGIYADGTTTNPFTLQSTNAMQRTTTNVNSTSRGRNCALYVAPTASCQFAVRDCVFFANSSLGATAVGVECGGTGSFISLKTSSCAGTTNDIKQDTGGITGSASTIQLSATDLVNANSDGFGFTVNTSPNQYQFVVIGSLSGAPKTYYLSPGTTTNSVLANNNVVSIPFTQRLVLFSWSAFYSGNIGSAGCTLSLYNTTFAATGQSGTLVSTILLNTSNVVTRLQNFSSTFNTNNYLQVVLTKSAPVGNTNDSLIISLSLY
jgi:hypothetical protein